MTSCLQKIAETDSNAGKTSIYCDSTIKKKKNQEDTSGLQGLRMKDFLKYKSN